MLSVARSSLKTLLGLAIRAEMDSQKVYGRLARRLRNPLLREKIKILAFEEKKHEKALRNLFNASFPKDTPVIPDKADEKLLPSVTIKPSSSLADVLAQAMNSEKAAENFYAQLSRRTRGDKRKILAYLSRVEKSHYLMLRSEYSLALAFEDYAEKDIDKVVT